MYDIVALGELLIDFTEIGVSENGRRLFEQNPGGAPANLVAAAARLGLKTAFIGKVGSDMHGVFLKRTLEGIGVCTDGLRVSDRVFTTLAFVALGEDGERSFSFARKPGADTQLAQEEVNIDILRHAKVFHFGSLSLTDEPAASATRHALSEAKARGAIISYDPNYREPLWDSVENAKAQMRSVLPLVDMLKLSEEETALLAGIPNPKEAALLLHAQGVSCVAVTLGKDGALLCVHGKTRVVPGFSVPVADTTGAGDAFLGAFLFHMLNLGRRPEELSMEEAAECARWGNAGAACCIQKRGAIPGMPDGAQIKKLLYG
ncbi:MAG: carbohydrate kinase [Clostridiaceae bacterium]